MRTQRHSRAPISQQFDSRHGSMDTAVIGDTCRAGFERHIEIGSQQNAPATELNILYKWEYGCQGDFPKVLDVGNA